MNSKTSQRKRLDILEKIILTDISRPIISKLKPYQVMHAQTLACSLKNNRIGFDGSDTGTGKTFTAIAVASIIGARPFIICPKPIVIAWFDVCSIFGVSPLGIANYEAIKGGKYFPTKQAFLEDKRVKCPYASPDQSPVINKKTGDIITTKTGRVRMISENVKWTMPQDTLVILDESHKGKNGMIGKRSLNSKIMVALKSHIDSGSIYCLLLSATLSEKIDHLAVPLYLMKMYSPFSKFAFTRFLSNIFQGGSMKSMGEDPKEILSKLNKMIFPEFGGRMTIEDIKDLTGNRIFGNNDVKAKARSIDESDAKEIETIYDEMNEALEALKKKECSAGCYLVKILRARQKIELLKIPVFTELIDKYLSKGNSVVIFVNFTETIDLIAEWMNGRVGKEKFGYIWGKQTSSERDSVIAQFQKDELRVVLCNIQAGGACISLHDLVGNHPRVSLISPTWTAIELKQALGRIYRSQVKSAVKQRIIYVNAGVEKYMCGVMNKKLKNISFFNDGDLGMKSHFDFGKEEPLELCPKKLDP
jgi:hypothetical protein